MPGRPRAVARTWVNSDAGSEGVVGAFPLLPDEIALLPVITASVFWYTVVNTVPNAALIVSVNTNVPLTIATPSTIANAVSAARSLRPRRPRSATWVTTAVCS